MVEISRLYNAANFILNKRRDNTNLLVKAGITDDNDNDDNDYDNL